MSQPPFQPPPPPSQPPQPPQQPPQSAYNPYSQPTTPQQQPPTFGPAPVPGQPPMQGGPAQNPGQPPVYGAPAYPAPAFGQQPSPSGSPVGAVLLGFFVSVIVSLFYSGLILLTWKDQTVAVANTLYLGHALINGAIVGALVGAVGHRNGGAWACGAVVAALGALFGYTNGSMLIFAVEESPVALMHLLEYEPFFAFKGWWNDEANGGMDWFSPLGLVLAAAAAWGIARLIGDKRRPA